MADEILADAPEISSLSAAHYLLGLDASSDEFRAKMAVFEDYAWSRFHPSVASGKYIGRIYEGSTITTSAALSANLATFVPFRIWRPVTIDKLCARVIAAGSNLDIAIYASNNTTGRPTGSPLRSTGSLVANSANASVENSSALSGGNLTFNYSGNAGTYEPGIYWFGLNNDNATLTVRSYPNGANVMAQLFGVSTLSAAAGDSSTRACSAVSTPLTFGTWGDLTSATWTEVTGANASKAPVPFLRVA